MKSEKKIVYFDKPGPHNTADVVRVVKERSEGTKIKYAVMASESGRTALKVAKGLRNLDVKVVCVTAYAGVRRPFGSGCRR